MSLFGGRSVIAVTLSLVSISAVSAADNALWVRQIETAGSETLRGIARGADEGVLMAGTFSGTIDFDPDAGVVNLTARGTSDAYVTRYDRDGRLVSAVQLGGAGGRVTAGGLVTAPGDVLYVAGSFEGTIDFDPGPGVSTLTSSVAGDMYVAKLNADGQLLWVRQIDCSMGSGGPGAIAADAAGLYFTGGMSGTCDFDPGPGTEERTINAGNGDFFIAALDAAGNFGWAGTFGSPGTDIPNDITVDATGNVYTVGRARGPIDYDPGPGTDLQDGNFFVLKQDPDGAELWARVMASGNDFAFGVTTDAGGVYVSGQFSGSMDFDPGPGTAIRTANATGTSDAFALKLDSAGAFVWVATFGGTSSDVARPIAVEPDGRVRVAGQFSGTVDFDPGTGVSNRTSAGSSDGFLLTLNATGQFAGAFALGGLQSDGVVDMVTDQAGNLIAYGRFSATVDFDPSAGSLPLTSAGGFDDFVWKYGTSELHLQGAGISFSPASSSFDVVKGLLSDLRATGTYSQASCLGVYASNPAIDNEVPSAGDGFYYLARGRSCCASEGYGDSTLTPDPRDTLDLMGLCP